MDLSVSQTKLADYWLSNSITRASRTMAKFAPAYPSPPFHRAAVPCRCVEAARAYESNPHRDALGEKPYLG